MILLILGVLLWAGVHMFKRLAPDVRAKMGDKAKGPIALALVVSIVLMVIGYRMAEGAVLWGRSSMLAGINNLLVLAGFYLFAVSGMKTGLARWIRHPQLTGFAIWAVGHLLVNGDVPSFVLFGGLLVWALAEMALINRAVPDWVRPDPVPVKKEAMAAVGGVLVFGVVAMIHLLLGYNPFG